MYSSRNSILLIGLTITILFLWCAVEPSYADTNEDEHHLMKSLEEDHDVSDEIDDFIDLHERASLRPVFLSQRASLRPYAGKRASLRPYAVGKRASLRPYAGGKRASLRPANYMGKRKRRSVMFYDE